MSEQHEHVNGHGTVNRHTCRVCHERIRIMARKGTGICCERCDKKSRGEA